MGEGRRQRARDRHRGRAMTDITSRPSPQGPAGQPQSTAQQAKDEAAGVATTAKDEAANVAGTAKEQVGEVASTAVEEAKHLGTEATEQAKQVFADARQQLQAKAEEESHRLGATVDGLSRQLRKMADAGDAGIARDVVSQAASSAAQVSQRLQQGGVDQMFADARRVARNRPGTFLLGAAAVGFIAARVARSVDTTALKEAATPSNGHAGNGTSYGDGAQWGQSQSAVGTQSQPSLGTQAPPTPSAEARPLVADPWADATPTQTMPTVE